MRLFRKKKQSKATVAAEKTEPTLIIEASNIQPKSYLPLLPSCVILQDWKKTLSTKVKSSNVKSSRTVYLISHVHQRLKSYGFIIMNNLKSWLPLFVPLSYYNVVMPKPLRLRHDFITSTTVVAYRLHFLMSIPSKLQLKISLTFNKRIALSFVLWITNGLLMRFILLTQTVNDGIWATFKLILYSGFHISIVNKLCFFLFHSQLSYNT